MKRNWSVRFEISQPDLVFNEDHADGVMSFLVDLSPALSYGPHTMSVRFCIEANSPQVAANRALALVKFALGNAGVLSERIVGVEINDLSDLGRSLNDPNVPDLVGVDEVAKMLDVSKQRASELAKHPDFPKPIARLASGPVWKKATIARHARTWDRRPGRKKALVASQ